MNSILLLAFLAITVSSEPFQYEFSFGNQDDGDIFGSMQNDQQDLFSDNFDDDFFVTPRNEQVTANEDPAIPNDTKNMKQKVTTAKLVSPPPPTKKCNEKECSICKDCFKKIDIDFPTFPAFRGFTNFDNMFRSMSSEFGTLGSFFRKGFGSFGSIQQRLGNLHKGMKGVKHSVQLACATTMNGTDVNSVCKKIVDGVEKVTKKHKKWDGKGPIKICHAMKMCDK